MSKKVKPHYKPRGGKGNGNPNAHGGSQAGRSRAAAGRLARDKGKVGQREALKIVKYAFANATNRYSGEEQYNGDPGRDLNGTPGFCFQVQLAQRPTIEQKLSEAQGSAGPDDIPVALTRRSSRKGSGRWLATLPAHLLMELIYFAKHAPVELQAPDFLEIG